MAWTVALSNHAQERCVQRAIAARNVVASVKAVQGRLPAKPGTVLVTDAQHDCAIVLAVRRHRRATVVTVLNYRAMTLPRDLPLIDRGELPERKGKKRRAGKGVLRGNQIKVALDRALGLSVAQREPVREQGRALRQGSRSRRRRRGEG